MTRSRVCPLCQAAFFLQVQGRGRRAKIRALLIQPEVAAGFEKKPEDQNLRASQSRPSDAKTVWAYEALKQDPEVVALKRRLVAGITVVLVGVAVLTLRHRHEAVAKPAVGTVGGAGAESSPSAPKAPDQNGQADTTTVPKAPASPPPSQALTSAPGGARAALEQFLAAESLEARLAWCRHPERVRALMERDAWGSVKGLIQVKRLEGGEDETVGDKPDRVEFDLVLEDGSQRQVFVVNEEAGYRVDWESLTRHSEARFAELKTQRPTQPQLLRVWVRAGKRFDGLFADATALTAVELREERAEDGEVLHAYALKTSEAGAEADFRLRDAAGEGDLPWTVVVRYPASAETADQVWLERVVEGSWLVEPAR